MTRVPVTLAAEYPLNTPKVLQYAVAMHSGTALYETYVTGLRNLDVYMNVSLNNL